MAVDLPSRRAQVLKGLAALLGTIVVVVGVPIALLAAFGTPWPDEKPTTEWLTQPTTGDTVLGVLAVVVWLAWLHFVICLVVEAVAERRDRGMAPQVVGGSVGTQALARRLVSAIVLLGAASGIALSTAGSASAAPVEHSPSVSALQSASLTAPQVVQVAGQVEEGELPGLGDLQDATAADEAGGATTFYDVKPPNGRHYDTLWDIADRYLGDGLRYKEIWALNEGVQQPDGRVLKNADLIHPGWVLKMPSDAEGPGLKVVTHDDVTVPADPAGGPSVTDQGAETAADATAVTDGAEAADSDLVPAGLEPFFGVAAGLALAGAALGLRRHRASLSTGARWTLRRPAVSGGPDTDPDPDFPGPGGRLTQESDVDTATWLDRALRSLGSSLGTATPARVSVGPAGVAVVLESTPESGPPTGWTRRGESAWALDRSVVPKAGGPAVLPGLVSVGRRDDASLLLLDLESVGGVVALEGDDAVARGTALSIAVDTATHPWADRRVVSLVGFADDLTAVGQGAIRRHDDLSRVLDSLDNVARLQRAAVRAAGVTSVREARRVDTTTDWTYQLVLCSGLPSSDEIRRLHDLAADPAVSLGVVVVGAVDDAALRLSARADGRLVAPLHGVDVEAQVLDVQAVKALTSLYALPERTRQVGLDDLVDVLEAERAAAEAGTAVVARVSVLGPVAVTAPGPVDEQRRALLTEIVCFLALHPDGVHINRLTAAIWPRGVEEQHREAALAQAGEWLGSTEDGQPVLTAAAGVWQLAPGAVRLDWDDFRDALNRAGHDGKQRESHLRAALDLVHGLAFAGVPAGRYGWLEGSSISTDVSLAVALTAQARAELAAGRGDEATARGALERGLTLLPASEELWRSALRLAAAFGEREDVESVADDMYAAIAQHGSPVGASATTDTLVDELLPGYRTAAA
ncbi:hypothetical protein ASD11_16500 [Aeromicrobium sp. Root495]|nr:hypothetical protein ASD11_16500 [Aeromicrobium sp. Root495]